MNAHLSNRLFALCAISTGVLAATPSFAGDIQMFAENNCKGPIAFRYPAGRAFKESCKSDQAVCRGKNDEARSMKVTGSSRPSEIRLYDGPTGSSTDDYSVIQFRKYKPEYGDLCVSTFERTGVLSTQGQITYKRKNGLDGKVSYVIIYP